MTEKRQKKPCQNNVHTSYNFSDFRYVCAIGCFFDPRAQPARVEKTADCAKCRTSVFDIL